MIDLDAIAAGILDGSINETNLQDHLRGDEGFRLAVLRFILDLVAGAGGSFDPASPGPIGGTTPAAGTFTSVSVTSLNVGPGGDPYSSFDSNGNLTVGWPGNVAANLRVVGILRFGTNFGSSLGVNEEGSIDQINGTNAQSYRIHNTFTDATTFERLNLGWDSNVAIIGTEKGSVGGAARPLELQTDGTTRLTISPSGEINFGTITFSQNGTAQNVCNDVTGANSFRSSILVGSTGDSVVKLGGATSSFPALKRNGPDVEIVGADDTAVGASNLILSSPNGTKYRLTVDNAGVLSTTAV